MRRLAVLLLLPLLASCKRESREEGAAPASSSHDTLGADDDLARIGRLDDGALYDRAMRLGECSTLEGVPCNDRYSAEVRCELALRADPRNHLHERLLADGTSQERARRGAALRVLTDFADERSVHLVHEALVDADPVVSCAAARYGTWFSRDDAKRLAELEQICDGKAVIAGTRAALESANPGAIAKGGVTCEDIRAAR